MSNLRTCVCLLCIYERHVITGCGVAIMPGPGGHVILGWPGHGCAHCCPLRSAAGMHTGPAVAVTAGTAEACIVQFLQRRCNAQSRSRSRPPWGPMQAVQAVYCTAIVAQLNRCMHCRGSTAGAIASTACAIGTYRRGACAGTHACRCACMRARSLPTSPSTSFLPHPPPHPHPSTLCSHWHLYQW